MLPSPAITFTVLIQVQPEAASAKAFVNGDLSNGVMNVNEMGQSRILNHLRSCRAAAKKGWILKAEG
ncbi:MAG: hypothetical protein ACLQAH_18350 [Limisphaerales bacterium]